MGEDFETRVSRRALERGMISRDQLRESLSHRDGEKESRSLVRYLVDRGYLKTEQIVTLRADVIGADPASPPEVRQAVQFEKLLVGKYVAVKELGRGGMGVVYQAWDGDLRRWVALKIISGDIQPEDLTRFQREAQLAASLRHPGIVAVYEIGQDKDRPYIVMELLEGSPLSHGRIPIRRACELLVEVARIVDHAHRSGIIHRDLKPQNIMLDAEGRPHVMDFGLAKRLQTSSHVTVSGTVVGTPSYMSPEQALGRVSQIDHRSDIYALGAVLFQLLIGKPPFAGSSPLDTLSRVVEKDPPRPTRLNSSIPAPLERIILQCLRKDKAERYASAEALAQDLERFLKGEPVRARGPRKRYLIPVVAALATFGATVTFLLTRSEPGPPPAPVRAPAPPPVPAPKPPPAERREFDQGQRLLEEARLDLYRPQADLGRTRATIEEAERLFTAALARAPQDAEAWLARGLARARLGRGEEAAADYTRAIQILPAFAAAYLARGRLWLDRMLVSEGDSYWVRGQRKGEYLRWRTLATQDLFKARDLGAPDDEVPFLETALEFASDDYPKAIERATRALENSSRKEEILKLRGDARTFLAVIRPEGRMLLEGAIADYTAALGLRANYPAALRMRAAALHNLGKPSEARADFEAGLRFNPKDPQAMTDLGTFHLRSKQFEQAIELYTRALAVDPRNFRAWANRGMARTGLDPAGARRDFEEALRINPDYLPAHHNLAVLFHDLGDTPEALRRLGDLIQRFPDFDLAHYSRGIIYYKTRRWALAISDLERFMEISPTSRHRALPTIEECRRNLGRK